MSGTSMATPHVAAVAALIASAKPTLTAADLRDALLSTATPASKCNQCTWRGSTCWRVSAVTCTASMTGSGVVDAYNAYLKVTGAAPPVKCWAGANANLQSDANQMRKFCKCAQGTYGYQSASGATKKNAYRYSDAADNTNWATVSASKVSAVTYVKCADGKQYNTNQDQYHAA
jgi:subtilisin family serine protease